jgi:hypothetical protein
VVAQAATPGEDGVDVAVGLAVGIGVALGGALGDVVSVADVEGESVGVELPQPASRPTEAAIAAKAIRIRTDLISLPPSRCGQGGHA